MTDCLHSLKTKKESDKKRNIMTTLEHNIDEEKTRIQ